MPEINRVFEAYRSRNVQVVAVGSGSLEHLQDIRARKRLTLPVPIATDAWREQWSVVGFPETLFIDRQGRIAERLLGGQIEAYFQARLEVLLAEGAESSGVGSADNVSETGEPAGNRRVSVSSGGATPAATATGHHRWYEKLVYRFVRLFH